MIAGLAAAAAVAFVNVTTIPMDRAHVESGQTVVVRGDRIVAIGAARDVQVPADATIIDGRGRYLVPGLTDAHVHINTDMPWAPARADFGDATLYLSYGVTTVINLSGSPTQLDWRRRIEAGELFGPTIYTSGPFVNEPRVRTPDEVEREVRAQARAGYDLIKYHELEDTTTGLSLPAYRKMIETAQAVGLPLVGHAPVHLGLDAMLDAHQPIAHIGMLSNIYFAPIIANMRFALITVGVLIALVVMAAASLIRAIARRGRPDPRGSPLSSSVRALTGWIVGAATVAIVCLAAFIPGGPMFASLVLRIAFTGVVGFVSAAALMLIGVALRLWRQPGATTASRLHAAAAATAGAVLAWTFLFVWTPTGWRSWDRGIDRLAKRVHDAGIPVQSTLIVYETFAPAARQALFQDPAVDALRADTRAIWRRLAASGPPGAHLGEFMRKLARALHREGVTLIAGTDAMGIPLVPPGSSLHRELQLLTESGLTRYEAIRSATVVPAIFLRKDHEFGTIAVGKRADLLLVDGNPLDNLDALKQPAGVMSRGQWHSRDELSQLVARMAH